MRYMRKNVVIGLTFGLFAVLLISTLFSGGGLETISGYVVKSANSEDSFAFYIALGIFVLIAAIFSYAYGVKKFGPA